MIRRRVGRLVRATFAAAILVMAILAVAAPGAQAGEKTCVTLPAVAVGVPGIQQTTPGVSSPSVGPVGPVGTPPAGPTPSVYVPAFTLPGATITLVNGVEEIHIPQQSVGGITLIPSQTVPSHQVVPSTAVPGQPLVPPQRISVGPESFATPRIELVCVELIGDPPLDPVALLLEAADLIEEAIAAAPAVVDDAVEAALPLVLLAVVLVLLVVFVGAGAALGAVGLVREPVDGEVDRVEDILRNFVEYAV